jgi:hypothetical protein
VAGRVAQVVENQLSKCEAPSSNPGTAKKTHQIIPLWYFIDVSVFSHGGICTLLKDKYAY